MNQERTFSRMIHKVFIFENVIDSPYIMDIFLNINGIKIHLISSADVGFESFKKLQDKWKHWTPRRIVSFSTGNSIPLNIRFETAIFGIIQYEEAKQFAKSHPLIKVFIPIMDSTDRECEENENFSVHTWQFIHEYLRLKVKEAKND